MPIDIGDKSIVLDSEIADEGCRGSAGSRERININDASGGGVCERGADCIAVVDAKVGAADAAGIDGHAAGSLVDEERDARSRSPASRLRCQQDEAEIREIRIGDGNGDREVVERSDFASRKGRCRNRVGKRRRRPDIEDAGTAIEMEILSGRDRVGHQPIFIRGEVHPSHRHLAARNACVSLLPAFIGQPSLADRDLRQCVALGGRPVRGRVHDRLSAE